jgi:hypothetical protein
MSTTPIGDLVAQMLAAGTAHEIVVAAVRAAELNSGGRRSRAVVERGARLSRDWVPSAAEISFALERGLPLRQVEIEAAKFVNYWTAKSGNGALKLDWSATWRSWCLKALEMRNGTSNSSGRRADSASRYAPTGADAVLAGMGRVAARLAQDGVPARPGQRQIPQRSDAAVELDLEPAAT